MDAPRDRLYCAFCERREKDAFDRRVRRYARIRLVVRYIFWISIVVASAIFAYFYLPLLF